MGEYSVQQGPGASSWAGDPLDQLNLAVAQLGADGLLIRANQAMSRLLGSTVLERGFDLRTLRWLTREGYAMPWLDKLIQGNSINEILIAEPPGAEPLQVQVHALPRHLHGQVVGADLCLIEAPNPVNASPVVAVADQSETYRSVAEHLADIVLVMEEEVITWASPSVLPILGYEPSELLGRPAPSLIHPDDMHDLVVTPAQPTMSGKSRLLSAHGTYTWTEFNISARFAPGGAPVTVYAVLRDITERMHLEELVESGQQRQRRALDASPDGFAIFRAVAVQGQSMPSFQLEFINEAGAGGFAGDTAALLGRDLLEFFPVAPDHRVIQDMCTALKTGRPQQAWITNTTGVGPAEMFTVQARLDEESIVSTWRDVSEQVEHTKRLARANAEADAARATLHGALNATSDGFVVFEIERGKDEVLVGLRVIHVNTAANSQFALVAGDLVDITGGPSRAALEVGDLWAHIVATISDIEPRRLRTHVMDPNDEWVASFDNTIAPDGRDRLVLTFRDATADERARRDMDVTRRQAEHAAHHDPLTGLPNRALLLRRIHEALAECTPGEFVGVVFCDLNGFKEVNDTHGHEAGDSVLKAVAERLTKVLRPRDTAARLAGDEFVLVLRDLQSGWNATDFCRRVTHSLTRPVEVGEAQTTPSASLGVVLADPHARPETDRRPDMLLAAADRNMYQNKAASRIRSRPEAGLR